jgi:hypothetical protein
MKAMRWIAAIVILAACALLAFRMSRRQQTVSFAGGKLYLPWPLRSEPVGSTVSTLRVRLEDDRASAGIDLLDERTSPVDAAHFVEHWIATPRTQQFHPDSVEEYHDAAVDAARLRCVRVRWSGDAMPVEVNCVTDDGRWKLVLLGEDRDIASFDLIAQQMRGLEQGS